MKERNCESHHLACDCREAAWVERVRELEAEVERLRAHTWQQERAAVVAYLDMLSKRHAVEGGNAVVMFETDRAVAKIERGEHWQESKP